MLKKLTVVLFSGLLLLPLGGCLAIVAAGGAGAGTAVWLSEKLTQQVNAPYERTIKASENALHFMNLEITKETKSVSITQLKSTYEGKEVWIDITRITENSTKIEVRVGAVSPDKEAASKILKRIQVEL